MDKSGCARFSTHRNRSWACPVDFGAKTSSITRRWLANNPKFELLFLPVYHPWVNVIERLWKTLHDTVTRNHRHRFMKSLMGSVRRFMQARQPWPESAHALAKP